jgi:hypothetical protein
MAFGWLSSAWMTPEIALIIGMSQAVYLRLWKRTLSPAGAVMPACSIIRSAFAASPEAPSDCFIWTWPARVPSPIEIPANASQPKSARRRWRALHDPARPARFVAIARHFKLCAGTFHRPVR